MKHLPRDIIISHKCSKNHDHMLYWSWDMARDGCNCYFSFWAFFFALLPFTPRLPNRPKNQNFKKMKKTAEIPSFYTCVLKIMTRWGTVPEIWCATDGWTDGQMDGWTDRGTDRWMNEWTDRQIVRKWHIVVGAQPKNLYQAITNQIWSFLAGFSLFFPRVNVL